MAISENILIQYLIWHFYDQPRLILKAWKNFLLFNLNYFSLPTLFKTFFSHWRRYSWSYPRGFDIVAYLGAWFSNLISRVLGAIMRSVFIVVGILSEILIATVGAVIFVGWFLLPFVLILFLYLSLESL
jgi:hypothetical protein